MPPGARRRVCAPGRRRPWSSTARRTRGTSWPSPRPGAGKTTFALRIATELLEQGIVRRVTVVAPTEHLKTQWADAAARVGIRIDPHFKNSQGRHGSHYDGVALTYAQVAAKPALHRARTEAAPTLVILDEVHHGGDALSWGDAVREAFEVAETAGWRSPAPRSAPTPPPSRSWSTRPTAEGIRRSKADYTYGYGEALRDHVVRPVLFMSYAGDMRWRTKMGDEVSARLGEAMTKDMTGQAWRTALDPEGQWIPSVLSAADKRLTEVRRTVPDAGGLVIATDQDNARAYATHLQEITGKRPRSSSVRRRGRVRAHRGVRAGRRPLDGGRAHGVGGSGRAAPRRRRLCHECLDAAVLRPGDRPVRPRPQARRDGVDLPAERRAAAEPGEHHGAGARPRARPAAHRRGAGHRVRPGGRARRRGQQGGEGVQRAAGLVPGAGGTGLVRPRPVRRRRVRHERRPRLRGGAGLPRPARACWSRTRWPRCCGSARRTTSRHAGERRPPARSEDERSEQEHRRAAELRKELSKLVSAWAKRSGQPHGMVHAELRRTCGGPEVPLATADQLAARVAQVRRWFVGQK